MGKEGEVGICNVDPERSEKVDDAESEAVRPRSEKDGAREVVGEVSEGERGRRLPKVRSLHCIRTHTHTHDDDDNNDDDGKNNNNKLTWWMQSHDWRPWDRWYADPMLHNLSAVVVAEIFQVSPGDPRAWCFFSLFVWGLFRRYFRGRRVVGLRYGLIWFMLD